MFLAHQIKFVNLVNVYQRLLTLVPHVLLMKNVRIISVLKKTHVMEFSASEMKNVSMALVSTYVKELLVKTTRNATTESV